MKTFAEKNYKKTFVIAGLGNISPRHLHAIDSIGGTIVGTYDVDKSRYSTVDSFEKLLELDAEWLVILTPNKLHEEMILAGLRAGKKIITEKPSVLSFAKLKKFELEDQVYTISQLRYMKSIEDLRTRVWNEGDYNVVLDITAHRDPIYLANWRGKQEWSGGLLYTIGIHYFDILNWIFGETVKVKYVRWIDDWHVEGELQLTHANVEFKIAVSETEPDRKRLIVDEKEIDLACGFFELHDKCYEEIFNDRGISLYEQSEAIKSLDKIISWRK